MARYAITIFLSAFLLFQVQPLIGKFILPWFGGSPAVWTTCMLFFQVLLLVGYSYAHLIATRLSTRGAATLHVLLLLGSLALLPITPRDSWKPSGDEMPVGLIMGLLGVSIGMPYFLLSSTGPLLQEQFRRETGREPYRLYALSNVGSLLALLTYPFVFEPRFKLQTQIFAWSAGYVAFVAFCAWCTVMFARAVHEQREIAPEEAIPAARPKPRVILLWLALAACGSVMLLATTNQMCQEVSSVPFLWVLPLSLYLLTFIICFDHESWYHRAVFIPLLAVAVVGAAYAVSKGSGLPMWQQLTIYPAVLWVCCMVCHGELVRARPPARYLTLFYLMVSAGGALGGVLVAIVAPVVFNGYWEYPLGLVATVLLAMFSGSDDAASSKLPKAAWIAGGIVSVLVGVALGFVFFKKTTYFQLPNSLETSRDFYGVLRVNEEEGDPYTDEEGEWVTNGLVRELWNGRILHGFQFMDEDKRHWPTTYYGHPSGVGLATDLHPRRLADTIADQNLRIGVIGLGCGTMAAYGREGDYIRFYEINPEVIRFSDTYFTFRKDTQAKVDLVLGDARIKMERELAAEQKQQFDVLVVDAFSSDAIPMHLLTKEAVELFLAHLRPDGILCIHISNRFLDLKGVVLGIAQEMGYPCITISVGSVDSEGVYASTWTILTRNWDFLNNPEVAAVSDPCWPDKGEPLLWTDDYGSMWQVLSDFLPWEQ